VENLVSGASYKPGDIIKMRKGLTVEITNTDAEGRLILADALAYACEEKPEMIIDIATLTGAAKVALGAEIAALFASDDKLAETIIKNCNTEGEPAWQLPLYSPYKERLKSSAADMTNAANGIYAGAITAALFLREFVEKDIDWIHFDIMGANVTKRPGRPIGGEAMCLRGLFQFIEQKFSK
jgi:leucyl aminopeptidase